MLEEVTLQINISPGDINYAQLTVPELVKKHENIAQRLLVVDCCRPQKTKILHPDIKFPIDIFNQKVEKIISIAEDFKKQGLFTQVRYLKPHDDLFNLLAKKYLRNLYNCTHSAGGTANMSYWAAIELPQTRYVLHYDGDLIMYQKDGYSWVEKALEMLKFNESAFSIVPRLCPPLEDKNFDLPSLHEGRTNKSHQHYWTNDFFSTRHFMLDKRRFESYFPLVQGKVWIELLLRKYGGRAFPIDPEMLIFKSTSPRGGKRMVMKSENAWFIHPTDKPHDYIQLLPQIIKCVNENKCPKAQLGHENINLNAWQEFLANS
jgi:hypothetical protein